MALSVHLTILAVLVVRSCLSADPTLLGTFQYSHGAFCGLYQQGDSSKYDLLLSSFGIFSADVSIVPNVGQYINAISGIAPRQLTTHVKWPNEIAGVPQAVLGTTDRYIAVPDGFLVPTKTDGSLSLINIDASTIELKPINGGGNWFYHRVRWIDMNKDGRLDALTARAEKPMFGAAKGELLWLTNPADHSISSSWTENVLTTGPDAFFEVGSLKVGSRTYEVIITAEFFHPKMRIFWTEDPKQNWANTSAIKQVEVATQFSGAPFEVMFSDLNGDKNPDILLTVNSAKNGTVVAFEVPSDFRSGHFKAILLADGYHPASSGANKGGPGGALIIPAADGSKPSIIVSGDDAGVGTLLTPVAPGNPRDWNYTRSDFLQAGSSTVGGFCTADVDGDGRLELFAPAYDQGKVNVYRI